MTYAEMFQYIGIGAPYLVLVIYACLALRSAIETMSSVKRRSDKESAVSEFIAIKTEAELFALRQKTIRELAYDAAGFVTEQEGKARKSGTPYGGEVKRIEAVKYMQRHIEVSEQDAIDALESTLGKVPGGGASGREKV